jgi:hypothetical protein
MALIEYYATRSLATNLKQSPFPVLIVVPATLTIEWYNKIRAVLPFSCIPSPTGSTLQAPCVEGAPPVRKKRRKTTPHTDGCPPPLGADLTLDPSGGEEWVQRNVVLATSSTALNKAEHHIVICSYDVAKNTAMSQALSAFGFQLCIADESHALRSPSRKAVPSGGSLVTERLVPLLSTCRYCLLLTATPAGKTGAHYQPQLQCLRPDAPSLGEYRSFANRYGKPMLRMTARNRDTVVYTGHTHAEELNVLLTDHLMYRLTNEARLSREEKEATAELAATRGGRSLTYRYTSTGMSSTSRACTHASSCPSSSSSSSSVPQAQALALTPAPVPAPTPAPALAPAPADAEASFVFASGTRQQARRSTAHGVSEFPLVRDRVVRNRTVHWINADASSTDALQELARQEKELQDALDETHQSWITSRLNDPDADIDVVPGSVDNAALEVQQKRNELLRRTSLMKVKLAKPHLRELLEGPLARGEKVVVMAYHRVMLNVCETVIRSVLDVPTTTGTLNPRVAAPPPASSASASASTSTSRGKQPKQQQQQQSHARIAPRPVPTVNVRKPVHPADWKATVHAGNDTVGGETRSLGEYKGRSPANRLASTRDREPPKISQRTLRASLPYIRLDGSVTSHRDVADSIARFQQDPLCTVALLSIPKACLGITLTAGTTMIMVELTHKPQDLLQAEARIDRRGQTATSVEIIYMLLKDSVEAQVWRRNRTKLDGAARMTDGRNAHFNYGSLQVPS